MRLRIKRVNLNTGGPLIAVLSSEDATKLNIYAEERIMIKRLRSGEWVVAVADIGFSGIVPGQIGLFGETFDRLGAADGAAVEVQFARLPESLNFVRAKLDGAKLTKEQIDAIVSDIVGNKLSAIELTYFVAGCYTKGMDIYESAYLTDAIVRTGRKLKFASKMVLDKHCTGGIPGNRTTMIVVPIVAAAGFLMPKTSSRAITSAAGTADVMEVFAPVNLTAERIKRVVKKARACISWGGAMRLAGADESMIRVRHPLSIDPTGMMLASIMAKKKAVGATHVLIDIPYGANAKFATRQEADKIKRKFEKIAELVGLKVNAVLTDGSQPVGNGIGPALDARDVLGVLHGDGPKDLADKSVMLATELLAMAGVSNPKERVLEILESGKAFRKFREIVVAQGGSKGLRVPRAKHFHVVFSKRAGIVSGMHNRHLARLARVAGAPSDKTAGVYLCVKKGSKVRKGDRLFVVYSQSRDKLDNAVELSDDPRLILLE